MEPKRMIFSARREPMTDDISIKVGQKSEDGSGIFVATSMNFEQMAHGSTVPSVLSLNHSEAQALMNELWEAGVRPSNTVGSVGQIEAMNRHLEDMRALVFKTQPARNQK